MKTKTFPVIAVFVFACSITTGTVAADSASHPAIALDRPWSPATPNGAATAAAYMTIENHGPADDRLLGGSSPLAGKVEVHEMSMAGGIMSMRAMPDGLVIPAGKTVSLTPQASYHLMLSGLKSPLKNGTELPLTLTFAKAGAVRVNVPVLPLGSRGPVESAAPGHVDHH